MTKTFRKGLVLALCSALMVCAAYVAFAAMPVKAETAVHVTGIEGAPVYTGDYNIKLTLDQDGAHDGETLAAMRGTISKVMNLTKVDGIYFDPWNVLQINIDKDDLANVPRVITLPKGLVLNSGAGATLAEDYTFVLYNADGDCMKAFIARENTIAKVNPLALNGSNLYMKFVLANAGNYTNNYIDDNMNYIVVNGVKLSEIDMNGKKWYDATGELGANTATFGFYPEKDNPIKNDGSDMLTVLAGFITGDGAALYKNYSYRFDGSGGIAIDSAEVVSHTEARSADGTKREFNILFSKYGANLWNPMDNPGGLMAMSRLNGEPLNVSWGHWYAPVEKSVGIYGLGHNWYLEIPEEKLSGNESNVLVLTAGTQISVDDAGQNTDGDPDLHDTRLLYDYTIYIGESGGQGPVEPPVQPDVRNMHVDRVTAFMTNDGHYQIKIAFDNEVAFTDAGFVAYREKTGIIGTTNGGESYYSNPTESYFIGSAYEIPLSKDETPQGLDWSKTITIQLQEGLTAYTASNVQYVLESQEEIRVEPLTVSDIEMRKQGEEVVFAISFNNDGENSSASDHLNDVYHRKFVQIRGKNKSGADVSYNLSVTDDDGIRKLPEIEQNGYASSWFEKGVYEVHIKNIIPTTVLDLTQTVYVSVLAGFRVFEATDPNGDGITAPLDSEEYPFDVGYKALTVTDHTAKIEKGAEETIISLTFNHGGERDSDHGVYVDQYRSKVLLDGHAINDTSYWGTNNEVLAWYSLGVYEIHIKNSISSEVFDFYTEHTLQVKAGFYQVDPNAGTELDDGKAYHISAEYVLFEDTEEWTVEAAPEPIEITEYLTELGISKIQKLIEGTDDQQLKIQFDRPVSYAFLPHINCPVDWLAGLSYNADIPVLPYSKIQLDYIVNNGVNTSVREKILIDGEALNTRNERDTQQFPNSIFVTYGQDAADIMSINFNRRGINALDMTQSHTVTFLAGFRSPLGGVISEDVTFKSDAATGKWFVVEK